MFKTLRILLFISALLFILFPFLVSSADLATYLWPARSTDHAFIQQQQSILYLVNIFAWLTGAILILCGIYIQQLHDLYFRTLQQIDQMNYRNWTYGIIIIALMLRVLWIIFIPTLPSSDPAEYLALGFSLAESHSYISDYRAVGYPFFLSVLFTLFGPYAILGLMANLIFTLLIIYLSMRIVVYLTGSEFAAKIASIFMALFPDFIASSSVFAVEPLFTTLLLSGFILIIEDKCKKARFAILVGVLFSFAAFVKPLFVASFVIPPVIMYFIKYSKTDIIKSSVIITITMILIISPWTIRNYKVMDEFVPIAPLAGTNLYMGNNPDATGGYYHYDHSVVEHIESRAKKDKVLVKEALKYIVENPGKFLAMMPYKLYLTYYRDSSMIDWSLQETSKPVSSIIKPVITIINEIIYHIILIMALVYIAIMLKNRRFREPVFITSMVVISYLSAFPAVFMGIPRLHYPMMPMIFIFAALLIQLIYKNRKTSN